MEPATKYDIAEVKQSIVDIQSTIVTKDEFTVFRNELMTTLDGIATGVKKIQEDHVFALEWMKKLQDKVDKQE